jgi:hypothetical protein
MIINDRIVPVQCDENKGWHQENPSDIWLTLLSICISTVDEFYFCFASYSIPYYGVHIEVCRVVMSQEPVMWQGKDGSLIRGV